ncbi:MAG: OmpA family protein [Prevotellaceae bacterium]|jgi:outer membrane protein OmpA-like peptidoglycan-associated protein|nr:OmpA family protein [Prevotellaceae bacterium]
MKRVITCFIVGFLVAGSALSQNYSRWSLAIKGGINYYRIESNTDVYSDVNCKNWLNNASWSAPILQAEYTVNPYYGIGLEAGWFNYNRYQLKGSTIDLVLNSSANLSNLFAPTRKGFWKKATFYGNAGLGIGGFMYNVKNGKDKGNGISPVISTGVNVDYNFTPVIALVLEGQYRWYSHNILGGTSTNGLLGNDAFLANIGLRFKFGATKDKVHTRNATVGEYFSELYGGLSNASKKGIKQLQEDVESINDRLNNAPVDNSAAKIRALQDQVDALNKKLDDMTKKDAEALKKLQNDLRDMNNTSDDGNVNFSLEQIEFKSNSSELAQSTKTRLDEFAKVLTTEATDNKICVYGHTDNKGTPAYNMTLSKERANSVKNYLISKGVKAASFLKVEGFGQSKPIASNDTEEGRTKNRRVEFEICK